ncbi:MAG: methionyl-tRNA formyltransferase [Bacteroidota bacterium]
MDALKIIFMGTPDFAVTSLAKLLDSSYKVVGVITAPDRPAGRGRKLQGSAVKKYAIDHGLKVLQPLSLKDETFLREVKSLNANLQVVVAFRMLPKVVWEMPKYGTFNLHASLLPNYRGAAPINWAIMNGETKTGVTTFFIDDKIDTGEIILQESMRITVEETAGSLHDKLMVLGADLVIQTVKQIEKGTVIRTRQGETANLRSAFKIHKETCKIRWNLSIDTIYNHIRGLSPYPTAWTTLYNGEEAIFLKIYGAFMEKDSHTFKSGTLLQHKRELKIAVQGGYIVLTEIQLPGKRKMPTSEVLNGLKLKKGAHVG